MSFHFVMSTFIMNYRAVIFSVDKKKKVLEDIYFTKYFSTFRNTKVRILISKPHNRKTQLATTNCSHKVIFFSYSSTFFYHLLFSPHNSFFCSSFFLPPSSFISSSSYFAVFSTQYLLLAFFLVIFCFFSINGMVANFCPLYLLTFELTIFQDGAYGFVGSFYGLSII